MLSTMKRECSYRLREGDQVPTRPTTIAAIMSDPSFALGVADARAGRPPRDLVARAGPGLNGETYRDLVNAQWNYERGRQWAKAPHTVPLRRGGQITPEAIRWYVRLGIP
jgi:hypothetical protein